MKTIVLICFTSFLFFNCTSEEILQESIEVNFNLINQEGIISTEFENGSQPIFNLQIANNSKHDVHLVSHNLNDENVFKVFSTTDFNEKFEPLSLGKPFKNAGCYYVGAYQ